MPVRHISYWDAEEISEPRRFDADIAVMTLMEVDDNGNRHVLAPISPISFGTQRNDSMVTVGYPGMKGSDAFLPKDVSSGVIELDRFLDVPAGVLEEMATDGLGLVPGVVFQGSASAPSGMSGGPVLIGGLGVCAVISSSYEPGEENPGWTTMASSLGPMLDLPAFWEPPDDHPPKLFTVRDLINGGWVAAADNMHIPPSDPDRGPARLLTVGVPASAKDLRDQGSRELR